MKKNFKGQTLVATKVGTVKMENQQYIIYRPTYTFTGITRCEPKDGGRVVFMFDPEFFRRFENVGQDIWKEKPGPTNNN